VDCGGASGRVPQAKVERGRAAVRRASHPILKVFPRKKPRAVAALAGVITGIKDGEGWQERRAARQCEEGLVGELVGRPRSWNRHRGRWQRRCELGKHQT